MPGSTGARPRGRSSRAGARLRSSTSTSSGRGAAADELGASVAGSLEEALAADILVTVTPGHAVLLDDGSLTAGQHVSLMGADGPGKAEITPTELARTRMFCDDWEQASHGGELAHAVEAGLVGENDVGRIGAVLAGVGARATGSAEITTFDSTGLAIQDLAIAIAAFDRRDELDLETASVSSRPGVTVRAGSKAASSAAGSPRIAFATRSPHAKPRTFPWPE